MSILKLTTRIVLTIAMCLCIVVTAYAQEELWNQLNEKVKKL
ncbi:hypothetical protein ACFL2Q_16940 [Thermodesulfobacteriota bacterium]